MSQSSSVPDVRSLPAYDLTVLGTGVLAFIFSFFPYYGVSVSGSLSGSSLSGLGNQSRSITAWHSYSTLALLLIIFGTVAAAAAIYARDALPDLPIGARWIAAGLCALGALLYLIRLFTLPHHSITESEAGFTFHASEGVRWGGYLLLIVVLANAAAAVMSALSSDEPVPWSPPAATVPPAPTPAAAPTPVPPPPPSVTPPPAVPPPPPGSTSYPGASASPPAEPPSG
jgi:hypothetical protein